MNDQQTIGDFLGEKSSAQFGLLHDHRNKTTQALWLVKNPAHKTVNVDVRDKGVSSRYRLNWPYSLTLGTARFRIEAYFQEGLKGKDKQNTSVNLIDLPANLSSPLLVAADVADAEQLKKLEAKRFKTYADEKAIKLLLLRLQVDPDKWRVGLGVGVRVSSSQINRGFRISQVDPEKKLALITSVADTGLTSSGGNHDVIRPQWVHMAELIVDNNYTQAIAKPLSGTSVGDLFTTRSGKIKRPENPLALAENILKKAPLKQAEYKPFFNLHQDTGENLSLTTTPALKTGTYVLDAAGNNSYGRRIGRVVELPISELANVEKVGLGYEDSDKFADEVLGFVKWINSGQKLPLFYVRQDVNNLRLYVMDGFSHVRAAGIVGQKTVSAVLIPAMRHPNPGTGYVQATLELLQEYAGVKIESPENPFLPANQKGSAQRPANPLPSAELMLQAAPLAASAYMTFPDFNWLYQSFYPQDETMIDAMRKNPYTGPVVAMGTYLLDNEPGEYGRDIGQVVDLPISLLENRNQMPPYSQRKGSTYTRDLEQYIDWYTVGVTPPPIRVRQDTENLRLYVVDGFRRVRAAIMTNQKTIPAVLMPVVQHPKPSVGYVHATLDLLQEYAGIPMDSTIHPREREVGDYVAIGSGNGQTVARILQVNPAEFQQPGFVTYKGMNYSTAEVLFFSESQRIVSFPVDSLIRKQDDVRLAKWNTAFSRKGQPDPYADESDPNIAAQMKARKSVSQPPATDQRKQALAKAAAEQKILAYQLKFL